MAPVSAEEIDNLFCSSQDFVSGLKGQEGQCQTKQTTSHEIPTSCHYLFAFLLTCTLGIPDKALSSSVSNSHKIALNRLHTVANSGITFFTLLDLIIYNSRTFLCLFGLFYQFSNKNKEKKKRFTRRRLVGWLVGGNFY